MNAEVNNLIRFRCSKRKLIGIWMHILSPFHRLSPRLIDVATELMCRRFELLKKTQDKEALSELLLGKTSREIICKRADINAKYCAVIIDRLSRLGFIKDGDINPKYIPNLKGKSKYSLMFYFDILEEENDDRYDEPDVNVEQYDQGED